MNKSFIKNIENKIASLKEEYKRICDYKSEEGFEIITSVIKRMYIFELEKIISNNEIRLSNAKKDGDVLNMLMIDQIFNGGISLPGRDGATEHFSQEVETIMSFDNQLEIAIDITKEFNLVQCVIPLSPDNKKRLEYNLVSAICNREFDLYENYNIFKKEIKKLMFDKKYIFNVEPYKENFDGKKRLGFKIMCV